MMYLPAIHGFVKATAPCNIPNFYFPIENINIIF